MITVDRVGNFYLNDAYAPDIQALSGLIENVARGIPQPELHIHADAAADFAHVGQVIDTAQGHGFARVHLTIQPVQK